MITIVRSDENMCPFVVFPDYSYFNDVPPNRREVSLFNVSFPKIEIETTILVSKVNKL